MAADAVESNQTEIATIRAHDALPVKKCEMGNESSDMATGIGAPGGYLLSAPLFTL